MPYEGVGPFYPHTSVGTGTNNKLLSNTAPATNNTTRTPSITAAATTGLRPLTTGVNATYTTVGRDYGWNMTAANSDQAGARRRAGAGTWSYAGAITIVSGLGFPVGGTVPVTINCYGRAAAGTLRYLGALTGNASPVVGSTINFTCTGSMPEVILESGEHLHLEAWYQCPAPTVTLNYILGFILDAGFGLTLPGTGLRYLWDKALTGAGTPEGALKRVPSKALAAGIVPRSVLSAAAHSFEDGTLGGWTTDITGTGGSIANSTAQADVGARSVLMTKATSGNTRMTLNVPVVPGTRYALRTRLWTGAGASLRCAVEFFTSGDVQLGGSSSVSGAGAPSAWSSFNPSSTVAPATAAYAKLTVGHDSGSTNGALAYFDRLSFGPHSQPLFTVNQRLAGEFSLAQLTGAVTKRPSKPLSASVATAGVPVRSPVKALSGTVTPGPGVITWRVNKLLAGSNAPAGALVRKALRFLSGSNTPTGAVLKTPRKFPAGTVTPGPGVLVRRANKALSGTVTPGPGVITWRVSKVFAGNITPSGIVLKTLVRYFTGAISTITGTVRKVALKPFTGTSTPGPGVLVRRPNKALSGAVTPGSPALRWVANKALSGLLTPVGAVTKRVSTFYTGLVTPGGAIRKVPNKPFTGAVTPGPSTMGRAIVKTFTGAVATAGAVIRRPAKLLVSSITSASVLAKVYSKNLTGFLYGAGVTPDWPVTSPTKTISGVVIDHETNLALVVASTVKLFRDSDDKMVATTTSSAVDGTFSFVRDAMDPYTYHYTSHYVNGLGTQIHGTGDRGIVPT